MCTVLWQKRCLTSVLAAYTTLRQSPTNGSCSFKHWSSVLSNLRSVLATEFLQTHPHQFSSPKAFQDLGLLCPHPCPSFFPRLSLCMRTSLLCSSLVSELSTPLSCLSRVALDSSPTLSLFPKGIALETSFLFI